MKEESRRKLSLSMMGNKRCVGRKYSKATLQKMSETHKRIGTGSWLKGRKISRATLEKRSKSTRGEKCYNWKGGQTKSSNGYILILQPNRPFRDKKRYLRRSRLIMEKHLGRPLKQTEHIHHINEKRDDDRIENLKLFNSNGEHTRFHLKGKEKKTHCIRGHKFTIKNTYKSKEGVRHCRKCGVINQIVYKERKKHEKKNI